MKNIPTDEECFHDNWARSIQIDRVMVDEFFEACTSPENRMIFQKLGDVRGKKILELGCGAGEASVYFAKKGAEVTATDVSSEMLEVVRKVAEKHGVTVETIHCPADTTCFENGHFDIVYAANLLHHVDIPTTLNEVLRVLRPGGMFVCWDPLQHNPIVNVYRHIANSVRTKDEHPLHMKDLDLFYRGFASVDFSTTWFFTLWIFIKFYFCDRIDPNRERYWKKILVDHHKLERQYRFLERIDRWFLAVFPFMRKYCWNIVIFAVK